MNQRAPAIAHRHVPVGQSPHPPSLRRPTDTAHFNTHTAANPERITPCHQNLGMSGQRRKHCGARSSGHTVFFKYIPNAAQAELDDAQSILSAQQDQLTQAQALLAEKEQEIAAQQAQIDAQQLTLTSQQQTLDTQQAQIEQLVGMRTRIITSLSSALRSANISAQVDPATGSIALESDVLFQTGSYDLSERGSAFVDAFLPVYLNVLFSGEYRPYVAEIIIEGHTDSEGNYLDNLQLSQRRALAVASYILDDGYWGISREQKDQLREIVTANGRSFSDPVLDAFGREDMDKSRRVVFKFRLTDEQMIQQLKSILETDDFASIG